MGTTITRSTDAVSIAPALVLNGWDSSNTAQTIAHAIIGRPDPDITLRPATLRTGSIRMLFLDAAAAETARAFHCAAATFATTSTLPWLPTRYILAGALRAAQQDNLSRWVLEVPYQELA